MARADGRITVRLTRTEIEQVAACAAALKMTTNAWVNRALRKAQRVAAGKSPKPLVWGAPSPAGEPVARPAADSLALAFELDSDLAVPTPEEWQAAIVAGLAAAYPLVAAAKPVEVPISDCRLPIEEREGAEA